MRVRSGKVQAARHGSALARTNILNGSPDHRANAVILLSAKKEEREGLSAKSFD